MLPIFYRMVRYVPAVGPSAVLETLAVRPVGQSLAKARNLNQENDVAVHPDRFFPSPPPLQPSVQPSVQPSAPHHYHLAPIWKDHMQPWGDTLRHILIASDNTAVSQPAMTAGRDLAARFNATVEIRHFEGNPPEIAKKILQRSRECVTSLLVLGTHGRKGKLRVKEGSVAEIVLKEAECSVLLVPTEVHWEKTKRILIPVGSSPESFQGIAFGGFLANRLEAEVLLLHLSENEETFSTDFRQLSTYIQALKWKDLEEQRGLGPKGIADTIVDLAKKNSVDLVLMGTHQETIHDELLPSSVCIEVLRQIVNPLWIHPLAYRSPRSK